jgi:hypothetical protein
MNPKFIPAAVALLLVFAGFQNPTNAVEIVRHTAAGQWLSKTIDGQRMAYGYGVFGKLRTVAQPEGKKIEPHELPSGVWLRAVLPSFKPGQSAWGTTWRIGYVIVLGPIIVPPVAVAGHLADLPFHIGAFFEIERGLKAVDVYKMIRPLHQEPIFQRKMNDNKQQKIDPVKQQKIDR